MALKEAKISEIRNKLDGLIIEMNEHSLRGSKIHEVELHLFKQLLLLGLQLLEYYILLMHEKLQQSVKPTGIAGEKLYNSGLTTRKYFSVFGQLPISRTKYYSKQTKTYYHLDAELGLPNCCYSYILTDWLSYGAVELDFAQSAQQLERILGHNLKGMQSSRQTYHLSEQVETYYQNKDWNSLKDGSHLSVGFDGKGIPIIRSETDRSAESISVRLSKGQKKGVKKEATISVSSSFTPLHRFKEEIISNLFLTPTETAHPPAEKKHQWHEEQHIRAFLSDKTKAINYGIDNLLKRDPTGTKPIVVLIDGDRALEKSVKQVCKERNIEHRVDGYILDFIHLLEYVWKVANAHLGENNEARVAWVQQQATLLLESQHKKVVETSKTIKNQKKLSEGQVNNIDRAISYLENRPHMLDYKTYLSKGFPITTGAVESACGHFIKSRMDRSAMHWGKKGAQKMLNIRAIKKNNHWDDYMQYFIKNEQQNIYKQVA